MMRQKVLRLAMVASTGLLLQGCVLLLPVTEFAPSTPDGTIQASNCLGEKSVHFDLNGTKVSVAIRGNESPKNPLTLSVNFIPEPGQSVRVHQSEIRIKPIDDRPEQVRPIASWWRSGKPSPDISPEEPMTGGHYIHEYNGRVFRMLVSFGTRQSLGDLPADGYRITLPAFEVEGKRFSLAPIEFKRSTRIEWFAPINC
jgi:hypothetical protein